MDEIGGQAEHAGGAAAPAPPATRVALPNGHAVTLHPEVTMPLGIAAMAAIRDSLGEGIPAVEAALSGVYLRFGIASWTFTDAQGRPEPVTPESIARLLPFNGGGLEVAEAADALYGEAVTRPLAARFARLSPPTPTDGSTPPSSPSGPTSPTPSAPSSPSGTGGKRSGGPDR